MPAEHQLPPSHCIHSIEVLIADLEEQQTDIANQLRDLRATLCRLKASAPEVAPSIGELPETMDVVRGRSGTP